MQVTKKVLKQMIPEAMSAVVEDNGPGIPTSQSPTTTPTPGDEATAAPENTQALKQALLDIVKNPQLARIQGNEMATIEAALKIIQTAIAGNVNVDAINRPLAVVDTNLDKVT